MKRAGDCDPPVEATRPAISGIDSAAGTCQNQAPCSSGRARVRQYSAQATQAAARPITHGQCRS